MTIPATPRRSPVYVGNGVSTDYAFGFKVLDPETVVVTVADENDLNLQVLQYLVDYTVTLNPDQDSAPGGEVQYADLPVGHRLVVTSDTESSQPTSIMNLGAFHANVLEGAIDRLAILHQQQEEKLGRCLQVAVTSELDPAEQLATSLDLAQNAANAAAGSANAAGLSELAAAGSAGDALLSEQAAAGSASDAEGFKDDAEDAAQLAAEWATKLVDPVAGGEYSAKFHAQAAATSKTGADTAKGLAEAARDAAQGHASAASGSASAASTSESNAAGSASSAQAAASTAASYLGTFRNKIINGGLDVWQRGTSVAVNTTAKYTADQLLVYLAEGSGAVTRQEFTDAPPAGIVSRYYARSNGGTSTFVVRLEDVRTLAGKTVTLSFKNRRSGGSGTSTITFEQNFGTGGSPSAPVTVQSGHSGASTTWTARSVTVTLGSMAGKTVGSDGNSYLEIRIPIISTGDAEIAELQLEEGSIATAFERVPLAVTQLLCWRYFYTGRFPYQALVTMTTGGAGITVLFPIPMRVVPTVTHNSLTAANYNTAGTSPTGTQWCLISPGVTWIGLSGTLALGATAGIASCHFSLTGATFASVGYSVGAALSFIPPSFSAEL